MTPTCAETVQKMKTIADGGVLLPSNSMPLPTHDMSAGGHGRTDSPALRFGKARDTPTTGRQVASAEDTPVTDLHFEMGTSVGLKVDAWGESPSSPQAIFGGKLPGLG